MNLTITALKTLIHIQKALTNKHGSKVGRLLQVFRGVRVWRTALSDYGLKKILQSQKADEYLALMPDAFYAALSSASCDELVRQTLSKRISLQFPDVVLENLSASVLELFWETAPDVSSYFKSKPVGKGISVPGLSTAEIFKQNEEIQRRYSKDHELPKEASVPRTPTSENDGFMVPRAFPSGNGKYTPIPITVPKFVVTEMAPETVTEKAMEPISKVIKEAAEALKKVEKAKPEPRGVSLRHKKK